MNIFAPFTYIKVKSKEVFRLTRMLFTSIVTISLLFLTACSGSQTSPKDADYDTTKKMIVDILQTEDGKKVLREVMTDEKMKEQLVIESDVVKESINDVLASEKGEQMWINLFKDPTFVTEFSKSMDDEQMKLVKRLMNDAGFQKQMLELLQNPEITEQMLGVMKSQEFRAHMEEVIQQTLETPLFQEKIKDTLLKAAEEQAEDKGGESKENEEGSKEEEPKKEGEEESGGASE